MPFPVLRLTAAIAFAAVVSLIILVHSKSESLSSHFGDYTRRKDEEEEEKLWEISSEYSIISTPSDDSSDHLHQD